MEDMAGLFCLLDNRRPLFWQLLVTSPLIPKSFKINETKLLKAFLNRSVQLYECLRNSIRDLVLGTLRYICTWRLNNNDDEECDDDYNENNNFIENQIM